MHRGTWGELSFQSSVRRAVGILRRVVLLLVPVIVLLRGVVLLFAHVSLLPEPTEVMKHTPRARPSLSCRSGRYCCTLSAATASRQNATTGGDTYGSRRTASRARIKSLVELFESYDLRAPSFDLAELPGAAIP
jgi:hypothetical protein